jgi:hypothetical protein
MGLSSCVECDVMFRRATVRSGDFIDGTYHRRGHDLWVSTGKVQTNGDCDRLIGVLVRGSDGRDRMRVCNCEEDCYLEGARVSEPDTGLDYFAATLAVERTPCDDIDLSPFVSVHFPQSFSADAVGELCCSNYRYELPPVTCGTPEFGPATLCRGRSGYDARLTQCTDNDAYVEAGWGTFVEGSSQAFVSLRVRYTYATSVLLVKVKTLHCVAHWSGHDEDPWIYADALTFIPGRGAGLVWVAELEGASADDLEGDFSYTLPGVWHQTIGGAILTARGDVTITTKPQGNALVPEGDQHSVYVGDALMPCYGWIGGYREGFGPC